ncbi:(Fe-S)-binding protein [Desulfoglaeba alkanexedens]|uniref:4Fe-4S domain-containing protein n=1 Tax=Desulfoglaeba alkanexedens ALDC TaxID=980445 RepID=A0A4P8L5V8_9BACT|nr:(Fe-S)-binding protein [Desulfoglaeba alkanexedens]QCQ22475.1 hypothetical protein FDQ92_10055 [Desulfoglaeba alkanexedens ALDC]
MKLNVAEILKHLPKTNCKKCGELTCMAFAARLAKRDISLEACPPLFTPEYESNRKALEAILKGAAA